MNDESSNLPEAPGTVSATASMPSRIINALSSTTINFRGKAEREAVADSRSPDRLTIRITNDVTSRSDVRRLFTLSIGLIAAGLLVGLAALLQRRRSALLATKADDYIVTPRAQGLLNDEHPTATREVRIRKEVVAEHQSIDVPVSHDEVMVEHRPVSDSAVISATPIGQSEEIRIPLTHEQLEVRKEIVVTDEFTVRKRSLDSTERVSNPAQQEVGFDDMAPESLRLLADTDSL